MGQDNLLVVRRRRSAEEHPAMVDLPDLEADFQEAMFAITENQVNMPASKSSRKHTAATNLYLFFCAAFYMK
jgi:hypothetical protein